MSVPKYADKLAYSALVSAERYIAYLKKKGVDLPPLPSQAVLSMSSGTTKAWSQGKKFRDANLLGFHFRIFDSFCIVTNLDIGGPAMSIATEELAALGVKEFYLVGIAGGLQSHFKPGDIVLADKALRDEGASYHYLPSGLFVDGHIECRESLQQILDVDKVKYSCGPTWTTDCPYRETAEELVKYRGDGILTVEMEAATLFSVAVAKGLKASASFVISDVLHEAGWEPHFYHKEVSAGYHTLLDSLSSSLLERQK